MLEANLAEVCEPYTYQFVNNLTNTKESLTRADGINLNCTLSLHLKTYVKTLLNEPDAADSDLVAENEPAENSTVASCNQNDQNTSLTSLPATKTKKDREKALINGDLHENLLAKQELQVAKLNKKKNAKKLKGKAWKEWLKDFIREGDIV